MFTKIYDLLDSNGKKVKQDVILFVPNNWFKCHKTVLAAKSKYFNAIFYGNLSGSSRKMFNLPESAFHPKTFEIIINHAYGKHVYLNFELIALLELFIFAHKYHFVDFELQVLAQIRFRQHSLFNCKNIWEAFYKIKNDPIEPLAEMCLNFINRNGKAVLESKSFKKILKEDLVDVVLRPDSYLADEVDIFRAVRFWVKFNDESETKELFSLVRFPLMEIDELVNEVLPTKAISENEYLDLISSMMGNGDQDFDHRGYFSPGENVAVESFGSKVIVGFNERILFKLLSERYDEEINYTSQSLNESILIKLGKPCFINTINMFLHTDHAGREYSYCIDISVDKIRWFRVIDRLKDWCRNLQQLAFETRIVRYIAITGTRTTFIPGLVAPENALFRLAWFECKYECEDDEQSPEEHEIEYYY